MLCRLHMFTSEIKFISCVVCVWLHSSKRRTQPFSLRLHYARCAFRPMSATEAVKFRFLYDVPLPLSASQLLPGPSKESQAESTL